MVKRHIWILTLALIVLIAGSIWFLNQTASAQDGNLLTNGSFEPPYYGQGSSTRTVPDGWTLVVGSGSPDAFPHNDPVQVLDGTVSWNLKQGYVAFTAVAYQRVSGLKDGDKVRFTAYGWVYTCNDTATSCVIQEAPYRASDTAAGASLRVGIDPDGGTDAAASGVKWSAPSAPYDQWAEMNVSATAKGNAVTVFIYMTQSAGLALNNVYWDKASLVRVESAPDATPTSAQVPFVVPQGVKQDGSIVHVVQAGDTLTSIAYAYRDYGVTNESIAELNDGIKANSRFLQIGQELLILAPGSVDPATGKLIPPDQRAEPSPEPTLAPAATLPPAATAEVDQGAAQPQPDQPPQETDTAAPASTYATVRASFFPFERGHMVWLEEKNQIFVLVNGETALQGMYSAYQDTWREGMPETDPNIQPPEGFMQPDRGFGQAWRTYPGVQDALGWGTGERQDYTALVVYNGSTILFSAPDGRVYELTEDGAWQATDYYQE